MDLAIVGQIVNTHGVKGEVRVYSLMDEPSLLLPFKKMAIETPEGDLIWERVEETRLHKNMLIIKFENIQDMDRAERFKGSYLKAPAEELPPLEPGSYYHWQLQGLKVITDEGEELGVIDSVIQTGSRDVFSVIGKDNREYLLPNIDDVIKKVDLDNNKMVVHLLPGLREAVSS